MLHPASQVKKKSISKVMLFKNSHKLDHKPGFIGFTYLSEACHNTNTVTVSTVKFIPFNSVSSSTGADNIKKYWSRYYQGSQGVVFVLDSASSDEDLEAARNELHSALQHPQLCTLPFLILANHQDKPAARTPNQVPGSLFIVCLFVSWAVVSLIPQHEY